MIDCGEASPTQNLIGSRTESPYSVISATSMRPKHEVRFGPPPQRGVEHQQVPTGVLRGSSLDIRYLRLRSLTVTHIRHTIAGEALVVNRAAQS